MKIIMYPHGGSGNRGCEAIVRGTLKILQPQKSYLFSSRMNEDYDVGLNSICNIDNYSSPINKKSMKYLFAAFKYYILKQKDVFDILYFDNIFKVIDNETIGLSIGGDNYCYGEAIHIYTINKVLRSRGIKTILWGCSVDENLLTESMIKDLKGYDLIVARESITYNAMRKINSHTILYPDPAFQLNTIEIPIQEQIELENTVGINVSPMIIENEEKQGMTLKNYCKLIEYIINETDMKIALIPHVIWNANDDRKPIQILYNQYKKTGKVIKIDSRPSEEIKGCISKCRFFIGARTHSTIAAYSSCVPTLVVGYSVKAKGIAKDLFGTYENYVLPVQSLFKENNLTDAFKWLYDNENVIRSHLQSFIPSYSEKALELKDVMKKL